jgi:hypothetical protein
LHGFSFLNLFSLFYILPTTPEFSTLLLTIPIYNSVRVHAQKSHLHLAKIFVSLKQK